MAISMLTLPCFCVANIIEPIDNAKTHAVKMLVEQCSQQKNALVNKAGNETLPHSCAIEWRVSSGMDVKRSRLEVDRSPDEGQEVAHA